MSPHASILVPAPTPGGQLRERAVNPVRTVRWLSSLPLPDAGLSVRVSQALHEEACYTVGDVLWRDLDLLERAVSLKRGKLRGQRVMQEIRDTFTAMGLLPEVR